MKLNTNKILRSIITGAAIFFLIKMALVPTFYHFCETGLHVCLFDYCSLLFQLTFLGVLSFFVCVIGKILTDDDFLSKDIEL